MISLWLLSIILSIIFIGIMWIYNSCKSPMFREDRITLGEIFKFIFAGLFWIVVVFGYLIFWIIIIVVGLHFIIKYW